MSLSPPLLVWCEVDRAEKQIGAALARVELAHVVARTVTETVEALLDHPEAEVVLASFVGVPLPHAQAACRRFLSEFPSRRLRLLGVLEPGQLAQFDRRWGLDDFVRFPPEPEELGLRLQMVGWRTGEIVEESALAVGPLLIDTARHEVLHGNHPVDLTVKEYELLLLLVSVRDRVLTREAILEAVWGEEYLGGERTVDVHVRRLRAKLPDFAAAIETVHGVGYRCTPGLVR